MTSFAGENTLFITILLCEFVSVAVSTDPFSGMNTSRSDVRIHVFHFTAHRAFEEFSCCIEKRHTSHPISHHH